MADSDDSQNAMIRRAQAAKPAGYDSNLVNGLTTQGQASTYRNDRATGQKPSPSPNSNVGKDFGETSTNFFNRFSPKN